MFGLVEKVEEKSLDFMKSHPKFTKYAIAGTTALATVGSSAVVASAEGEETTSSSADVVDTVVDNMSTSISGVLGKVLPVAIGIGVSVLAVTLAWKWMKKFIHG